MEPRHGFNNTTVKGAKNETYKVTNVKEFKESKIQER
jgi:hypothetical protein